MVGNLEQKISTESDLGNTDLWHCGLALCPENLLKLVKERLCLGKYLIWEDIEKKIHCYHEFIHMNQVTYILKSLYQSGLGAF